MADMVSLKYDNFKFYWVVVSEITFKSCLCNCKGIIPFRWNSK